MSKELSRLTLFGVGLIACSTLLFETALTRIFAVTLWYYFGTLSISLAMLGMAVAAILCYLAPERLIGDRTMRSLSLFAIAFSLLAPLAIFVHLNFPFTTYSLTDPRFTVVLSLQIILLFLAFFAAGMCISIAIFNFAVHVSRVYFFDLVGASIGSFLVVPLLYHSSAPAVIFFISTCSAMAAILFSWSSGIRKVRLALGSLALVFLALFLTNDKLGLLAVQNVKSYSSTNVQVAEPSRIFEKWSPVSRIAVFSPQRTRDGETMAVTNDGGAPTTLRRFTGDFSKVAFLASDFREIVHHLKQGGNVLIIGSAGGTDVLSSLLLGREKITAVEINPVIAELVTNIKADYIGNIFSDSRVTLHIQEGRNYTAGSTDSYDIIQMSMIDSWGGAAAGAYIFNENALYTAEAVVNYWDHLKSDGVLSISRYYSWGEGMRLTNTFVQHLLTHGVTEPQMHLVVIAEGKSSYKRATVLMKKSPFTLEDINTLHNVSIAGNFDLVYAPYLEEKQMLQTDDALTYRQLIHPQAYPGVERNRLVAEYPRDISPSTDNRPFFFFTNRFPNLFDSEDKHPARQLAMPILYGTFAIFAVLAVLSILVPLWLSSRRTDIHTAPFRNRLIVYFALLGMAYMMVEISLIQRLTVFLGHPTYSFVVVLATLLFASGVGSYVSGLINRKATPKGLITVLAAIVVLLLIYLFFVFDLFIELMPLPKLQRILLAIAVMLPPGFIMGMAFPMGIPIARRAHPHLVPWGWGVNGAFSVFASLFSLFISLNFGLKTVLSIGVLCYAFALVIIWSIRQPADASARTERYSEAEEAHSMG